MTQNYNNPDENVSASDAKLESVATVLMQNYRLSLTQNYSNYSTVESSIHA